MGTIYQKRMQPIWAQLTRGGTQEERDFNIKLVLNSRQGDYLIKSQDKDDCVSGMGILIFPLKIVDGIAPQLVRMRNGSLKRRRRN